jgi:P27 family predicted phage terminase small subunit
MPRKKLPAGVRAIRGSVAAMPAPEVGPADPAPPSWLSDEALTEWHRVTSALRDHPEWLRATDRAALAAYCASWAAFVEAAADVASRGVLVPARSSADQAREGGPALVKNPAVQVMRDAQAALRGWAGALGFTPDARGRVQTGTRVDRHQAERLLS